jgi:hypothetical protein
MQYPMFKNTITICDLISVRIIFLTFGRCADGTENVLVTMSFINVCDTADIYMTATDRINIVRVTQSGAAADSECT